MVHYKDAPPDIYDGLLLHQGGHHFKGSILPLCFQQLTGIRIKALKRLLLFIHKLISPDKHSMEILILSRDKIRDTARYHGIIGPDAPHGTVMQKPHQLGPHIVIPSA